MGTTAHPLGAALRHHLRVVARHVGLIAIVTVVAVTAAVLLSLRQPVLYEASAEVLLGRGLVEDGLTGTPDPILSQDAQRVAQTQADLARVPAVAERTLEATGATMTLAELVASSSVTPATDADILVFEARAQTPELAATLASEYARQFTAYRLELDTAALVEARAQVEERLGLLEAQGDESSSLYASLAEKEAELRTMEALQTSNAFVVREAGQAEQVQPRAVRNGVLAFLVGLALGVALAYLRETLDTRVRSAGDVAAALRLPLLARLPRPPKGGREGLVMLARPGGASAEPFRMLRTNLEFASLDRDVRALLVTSALPGEGKSTTAANLALAFARAGRRAVLVDLDLRRPALARLFGLEGRPGVTDVALRRASLESALAAVAIPAAGAAPATGNGHAPVAGTLEVLPAGTLPPDAGEFVGSRALAAILEELRARADVVVLDGPPLLAVGDALALSAGVDGVVVLARLGLLRRPALHELARVLAAVPAPVLGYALANAERDEGYGEAYGYESAPGAVPAPARGREPVSPSRYPQ